MKLKTILTLSLLFCIILGYSKSDSEILTKTSQTLQNLKSVKYQTKIENIDPMGVGMGLKDSSIVYYDFTSDDNLMGAKYLFKSEKTSEGFNGTVTFLTDDEKLRWTDSQVKTVDDLFGIFYSAFPILTIRKLLPQMITNKSIDFIRMSDTITNHVSCFQYKIIMHDMSILMNMELKTSPNTTKTYKLVIGKKDYLPRQFISYFENDSPVWIVNYYDYDLSFQLNNSIFDYESGYSNYEKFTLEDFFKYIANEKQKNNTLIGKMMEDWTLPSMSGDNVTLSQIDSKLILLEFWFPNCGGCIRSAPMVNEVQKMYNDVKVYGIEFTKPDSTGLAQYISRVNIKFPTLYTGKKVAENNFVSVGSTVFLLDNHRKILYTNNGFNKDEVIKAIEENLK